MKTFKELYEACCSACEKRAEIEEVKEPTGDLKDACWKGYTAVGMKMKNGRKVPNCVPANEEAEQIDEMDKTQSQQGGHGVTEPYDYGKGKWSKAEIMTNKEVAKKVKFDVGKLLKIARDKKKIKEEVEQIDENLMMAAAASANQPKYTERTAEQEKKHAERKAEKYLHMPGKNAAKKRKYWVKKVNKLHGIPEEVEQIDEISKGTLRRYSDAAGDQESDIRYTLKRTALSKHLSPSTRDELTKLADRRKAGIKLAKDKRGYYKGSDAKANFTHGDAKVPATEETQKGKNVVPPHVGALATGGIVKEATYQGKEVPLNKPMAGDVKKSKVYVDPDGDGKAQKVNFGDKNMTIKKHIPGRRKNFRARHNCDNPGPKTKARYWSCKAW